MSLKTAFALRLLLVLVAVLLAPVQSAEQTPSLLGSTRDQVIRKLGEPRSQLEVGNRLVMLYARERVVLRDGVVVEVERLAAEPVRRPPPAPAVAPAPSPTPAAESGGAAPATPTPVASTVPAPAVIPAVVPSQAQAAPANPENVQPPPTEPAAPVSAPAAKGEAAPATPEPKVEIKLIRPPTSGGARPAAPRTPARATPSTTTTAAPPASPGASATVPTPTAGKTESVAPSPGPGAVPPAAPSAPPVAAAAPAPVVQTVATPVTEPLPEAATRPAEEAPAVDEEKAKRDAAAAKKAKVIQAARRRLEATLDTNEPDPTVSIFSARTYIIAIITVAGGIGFLVWRGYQRRLELAATAVSRTPFEAPASGGDGGGSQFTTDLIGKLEWKRFEELVEAYYSKTGVVAQRCKGGPTVGAQVKISWKGEQRPFALVRCISHHPGLIEVKPLQELFTLLAAEDIRRGYVVSTSKFSVPARDYAEEKHLTLLSGDLFLEKLNALPEAARTELMQIVTSGDYSTPSCPICEAKMAAEGTGWRCASHPTATVPGAS